MTSCSCSDTQPEFLDRLGTNYAHKAPMAVADIVANIGDVRALSMERHELSEKPVRSRSAEAVRITGYNVVPALRTGNRMASLHASRTEQAPYYQQLDISLFELLSPPVCRALTISDALDIRTLKSEMLEKTLDVARRRCFPHGPEDGRIVYMNDAAERQTRAGSSLRIVNNQNLPPIPPHARPCRKPLKRRRAMTSRWMAANIPWRSRMSTAAAMSCNPHSSRSRSAQRDCCAVCSIGGCVHTGSC